MYCDRIKYNKKMAKGERRIYICKHCKCKYNLCKKYHEKIKSEEFHPRINEKKMLLNNSYEHDINNWNC